MTAFEKFWSQLVAKNPSFDGDDTIKVTMSIAAIRKLNERAHSDGFRCGFETAKSLEKLGGVSESCDDMFSMLKKASK
jgi:hypothetical protein